MSLDVIRSWKNTGNGPCLPRGLRRTVRWLPQIGDFMPDFGVRTTHGPLRFHDWAEGGWVYLFSHLAAHTPVCTTELVSLAMASRDFASIGVKCLAITGSSLEQQRLWHRDIEALYNISIDFPCAEDIDGSLAETFGMYHAKAAVDGPIRKSFIINPSMNIAMIFEYPVHIGRSTEEIIRTCEALILCRQTGAATPADWWQGDPVLVPDGFTDEEVERVFGARPTTLSPYVRMVRPCRGKVD